MRSLLVGRDHVGCLEHDPTKEAFIYLTSKVISASSLRQHHSRLFPFLQLHSAFPVDSLRVRWVPLFPSFQRLGAFAFSPRPGVPSFPGLRLLCPIRLL